MRKALLLIALTTPVIAEEVNEDLFYLARTAYFESRGESLGCQIFAAQTVLTRTTQQRFPASIQEVVEQKSWVVRDGIGQWVCQYSYFCDGRPDVMIEGPAKERAFQAAEIAINTPDITGGADHYYAHEIVYPNWAPLLTNITVCDRHTFGTYAWDNDEYRHASRDQKL